LLALAAGCTTNPATGEKQLRIISTYEEVRMGRRIDAEVRKQYRAVSGTAEAERIARIGARVAAVAERRDVSYSFTLLETRELNAFAAPGGFVYVTTELIDFCESDAELAAVIGHEVGHISAMHSVQQMQRQLGYQILRDLAVGEEESQAAAAADIAFDTVVMTGFSREQEFEADKLGVRYSAKAGYNPYGMANFLIRLAERNRETIVDRVFEFLLSHPNLGERSRRAERYARQYAGE